jgi:hypothetical protein
MKRNVAMGFHQSASFVFHQLPNQALKLTVASWVR